MSRSTNENDSSSCEPRHNTPASISCSEDIYTHPFITDYDVGMVVQGPPPLQACNSCHHFQIVKTKNKIDKHPNKILGVCQVSLPIINEDLIFEDLNSSCWNFCLREDLLKLKIQRLRSQNANGSNKLHAK